MAGIGFRLREIFEHDTYIDNLRGTLFSTAIAGGPIFFPMACLMLLGVFSTVFLPATDMEIFFVTVVYVYAFSMIAAGVSQLLITRYLADLLFANKRQHVLPAFSTALAFTIAVQAIIGLPCFFLWKIAFLYKLTVLLLFITMGCIWQVTVFLSTIRDYKMIAGAFAVGMIAGFAAALFLGQKFGLTGFLHGYTVGHLILLFILLGRILLEFKSEEKPDMGWLGYLKIMPQLLWIGLFYNAGIWIDKIIFWFSKEGRELEAFLYSYLDYDAATFLAFVTVLPSYVYFFVRVETDFYEAFRGFFGAILSKQPLQVITENKRALANSVRESLLGMVKIQGFVTVLCLLYANELAGLFRLPPIGHLIIEKSLIAAMLQMLLMTVMIFMMYLDMRNQLVVVSGIFLLANIFLTLVTLSLGYLYYGYGYLLACLLALTLGCILLHKHITDLEFRTFSSQPVAG